MSNGMETPEVLFIKPLRLLVLNLLSFPFLEGQEDTILSYEPVIRQESKCPYLHLRCTAVVIGLDFS